MWDVTAPSLTPLRKFVFDSIVAAPIAPSGLLTGVKLCGEAQANAGTCGPESEIGETIVSVGLGNDPFTVTGGKAYITEKYDGGALPGRVDSSGRGIL